MDQMGGALGVVVPPEAAMLFGCVAASVAHPCLPDAMFALGCHGDRGGPACFRRAAQAAPEELPRLGTPRHVLPIPAPSHN